MKNFIVKIVSYLHACFVKSVNNVKRVHNSLLTGAKFEQHMCSISWPPESTPLCAYYLQEFILGVSSNVDRLICDKFGHKYVDYGHAGPDSGPIDLECSRCGYSHHEQLY